MKQDMQTFMISAQKQIEQLNAQTAATGEQWGQESHDSLAGYFFSKRKAGLSMTVS
jgi:hypothetical protein